MASETTNLSEDQYFSSNHAPESIDQHISLVRDFVDFHSARRIVLVTSGGTTVPLEKRTVRYSKQKLSRERIQLTQNSRQLQCWISRCSMYFTPEIILSVCFAKKKHESNV